MADTLETETLELGDIQGLVVRAYHMPRAVYLFYRFTAAAPARAWLGAMADPARHHRHCALRPLGDPARRG